MLDHYPQFQQHVQDVVLASQVVESQQEIPATEGQQLANLSAFSGSHSAGHSIFDFEDDASMDDNIPSLEIENIPAEIRHYRSLALTKEFKENCNVLNWWKENKATYPCLFKAAQAYLNIPATSVPSARMFSLLGYMVRCSRSKILPSNVNKIIFLMENEKYIPKETPIWNSS